MSKVLKVFLLTCLTALFLFNSQFSKPALADVYDARITVTQSPDPVYADSGTVAFEIKGNGAPLPTGVYEYSVTIPNNNRCSDSRRFRSNDPDTILVTVPVQKNYTCTNIFGVRTFVLYYLPDGIINSPTTTRIVWNYNFDVQQAGGGNAPSVQPLNQHLGISETPEVIIHNVKNGTTYSFWWEGSGNLSLQGVPLAGPIATHYTADHDGDSRNIQIDKVGVSFNRDETKILCMAIGNYLFVYPTIPCEPKYQTTFVFSLIAPPSSGAQPKCSISTKGNSFTEKTESFSVVARSLPKNEDFKAELVVGGTTIPLPQTQNSHDNGIISIPLAASLIAGDYTAKVYKTSGDFICEEKFTVTPAGTLSPAGGGIKLQVSAKPPCGSDIANDPGTQTAIGCLHTNPASLVKDFLKFIIGISGGLAFLMMLLGAFQMMTSAGNPDTLAAGRDRLTNAIIGLLFVIFAVLLLKIIGFDILGLPGF